jgi:hypothetical protein
MMPETVRNNAAIWITLEVQASALVVWLTTLGNNVGYHDKQLSSLSERVALQAATATEQAVLLGRIEVKLEQIEALLRQQREGRLPS